jgi:uncharacterized membrane protein
MKENARIEAFSDGVFAIAATLLVLELKVPSVDTIHSVGDLWRSILLLWPSFFAFIFSFGILLVSWVNHHYLFNALDKSSRHFIYANGFFLLTITFMPFSTALLARYISTEYAQPAIVFYCFGGIINSLGWNMLLHAIHKPRLLIHEGVNTNTLASIKRSTQVGFLVYVGTTILAFWFPMVALIINLLLWLVWIYLSISE